MAGKFVLSKASDGEFRFVLKAGNGETILVSELYKAKASAENGIASIKKNAHIDAHYERKEDKNGHPRFNLKAGNGEVIGASQSYHSVEAREHGIESVKHNAPEAEIEDLT
ncbi:YegP family protein [Silvibacterium dinghuense]|uniref:DUF1508 domain-containing protein n=1 Tax=Silvibacterium dinghuense TaxID=1560006 RepID=A0A4Q1SIR3_9BACT|nr:YegP family protein [Silvibacterium dinghuense]RXS97297.1 DUF1508 domain-containing protein [Silvibacterium dinghuense]GGG97876.1 hypothetical protein GCM10011586_11480 [Silvibacterium dinghuense]